MESHGHRFDITQREIICLASISKLIEEYVQGQRVVSITENSK